MEASYCPALSFLRERTGSGRQEEPPREPRCLWGPLPHEHHEAGGSSQSKVSTCAGRLVSPQALGKAEPPGVAGVPLL